MIWKTREMSGESNKDAGLKMKETKEETENQWQEEGREKREIDTQ